VAKQVNAYLDSLAKSSTHSGVLKLYEALDEIDTPVYLAVISTQVRVLKVLKGCATVCWGNLAENSTHHKVLKDPKR
jgi:hypothetical protein